MNFLPNEKILAQLNELIEEWRTDFYTPPTPFDLEFSINTCNMLVLNGIVICSIDDVTYDCMDYDAEALYFADNAGHVYEIELTWSYGEVPSISCIRKSQIIYCAS